MWKVKYTRAKESDISGSLLLTLLWPIPEATAIWCAPGEREKSKYWCEICIGCLNAVANTFFLGVAIVTCMGRGTTIWGKLFLLDGAGVGGAGVAIGLGASVWLTVTGIMKS